MKKIKFIAMAMLALLTAQCKKNEPLRMCIVTREKLPKFELIRVVRTPEGNVVVDTTSKLNGRGVYLKKDLDVVKKAKNTKILEKQEEKVK